MTGTSAKHIFARVPHSLGGFRLRNGDGAVNLVHFNRDIRQSRISIVTRPTPLSRLRYQAALHRVVVAVVDLLDYRLRRATIVAAESDKARRIQAVIVMQSGHVSNMRLTSHLHKLKPTQRVGHRA